MPPTPSQAWEAFLGSLDHVQKSLRVRLGKREGSRGKLMDRFFRAKQVGMARQNRGVHLKLCNFPVCFRLNPAPERARYPKPFCWIPFEPTGTLQKTLAHARNQMLTWQGPGSASDRVLCPRSDHVPAGAFQPVRQAEMAGWGTAQREAWRLVCQTLRFSGMFLHFKGKWS